MKTTVSSRGQLVLPAELRRRDRIKVGQRFEVERVGRGESRLRLEAAPNEGVVDWLLACPRRGTSCPSSPSPPTRCELPRDANVLSEPTRPEPSPQVAATALTHGLTVATRNRADFQRAGVAIVDPFGAR